MGKTLGQRPSDILDVEDRWAAYQLDSAVIRIGIAIENALQETLEIDDRKRVPKYTLEHLLSPEGRLENIEEEWPAQERVEGMFYDEIK